MTEQFPQLRSYEVSIWTLQDEFISVLKESRLEKKGQIQDPKLGIKDDGTLTFSFKIPMYIYQNGVKVENPNWYNTINGNLMITMRKLKVIFYKDQPEKKRIFEFIITQIEESHSQGQTYCEVSSEGLAFHELGKNGYKVSLSSDMFIKEYGAWQEGHARYPLSRPYREKDKPLATLDYWNEKIGLVNKRYLGKKVDKVIVKNQLKMLENAAQEEEKQQATTYEEDELQGITSDNIISGEEPFFDDLPVVREQALLISFDPTVYDTSNDSSSSNGEHQQGASLDDNTDLTPEEIEECEREKQRIVKILEKGVSYSLELDNISKTWAEAHGTFFPEPTEVSKIKLDGKNLYDVIGLLSFDETYYDTEQNSTYSVEYDLKESIGDEKDPSKIYHIVVNFNPKIEPYITIRNKSLVHSIVNDAKDQSYLPKYLDIEPINGMSLDDLEASEEEKLDSDSWININPGTGEETVTIQLTLGGNWDNLHDNDEYYLHPYSDNARELFSSNTIIFSKSNPLTTTELTIEIPSTTTSYEHYIFGIEFISTEGGTQIYYGSFTVTIGCDLVGNTTLESEIGSTQDPIPQEFSAFIIPSPSEPVIEPQDDEAPEYSPQEEESQEEEQPEEELDTIIETTYDIMPDPHIWYYKVEMNYSGQSYSQTLEEELAREDPNEFHEEAQTSADSGTTSPYTEQEVGQFYRKSYKVYEESYVSSWDLGDGAANPNTVEPVMEKARLLDEQESNIYNLTQKIAETFGVFCRYEYEYDDNNHITCRTVVYYNNFLNEADGLLGFTYPYQTTEISRNMDSTDLVTKMYVKSVDSSQSASSLITIMDAAANKSKEDYLLNFDYLYSIGTINSDQYKAIEPYEARLAELNAILADRSEKMLVLDNEIIDLKAKLSLLETSIPLDEETINNNYDLLNELATEDIVSHKFGKTIPLESPISNLNPNAITLPVGLSSIPPSNDVSLYGTGYFHLKKPNIVGKSIRLYSDEKGKKPITHFFISNDGNDWLIYGLNHKWVGTTIYIAYDIHEGYAALHKNNSNPELRAVIDKKVTFKDSGVIATSIKIYKKYDNAVGKLAEKITKNWKVEKDDYDCASGIKFTKSPNVSQVYVTYDYVPKLYYDKVISTWRKKLAQDQTNYDKYTNEREAKLAERDTYQVEYDVALAEKKTIIDNFVKLMGPALREGNWTPDDYEGKNFGNSFIDKLIISSSQQSEDNLPSDAIGESGYTKFIWDEEPFTEEQLAYYENGVEQEHIPYLCIKLRPAWLSFISQCLNGAFDSSSLGVGLCYYDNTIPALQAINYMQCYSIGSQSKIVYVKQNSDSSIVYPVLLLPGATVLTDDELQQMKKTATLGYFTAKSANNTIETQLSTLKSNGGKVAASDWLTLTTDSKVVYPRIKINSLRMKDTTDELKVVFGSQVLKRFEDYSVLQRDGAYYITLKPEVLVKFGTVAANTNGMIFTDTPLYCGFKINTTDNAIYLDAKQILKENSQPKVSYTIKPTVFDQRFIDTAYNQLGRIVNINDWELKFENVQGYISSLELDLDMPQNDSIEIKNYKTKFEDLFSSIIAQTEEMKRTNFTTSGIVSNFNTDGSIKEDALSKLLEDNNALIMAYLNAHYAELTSATEQLEGIFEEAGNIFASAVSAQTTSYQASQRNARVLKSFARDVRRTITPSYTVSQNPPTNFKPGDMWVQIDESGREIGHYLSMIDNLTIQGNNELSGWNRTYDGTLASITGARMEVDAEAGLLTLEAESTINARAGSNIYLASKDIQITGNSQVNIGGKYINIGAESGINLISSGLAELPKTEEGFVDLSQLQYDIEGGVAIKDPTNPDDRTKDTPLIAGVSLNSNGIKMTGASISMQAGEGIALSASQQVTTLDDVTGEEIVSDEYVSAVKISPTNGIFLGASKGVTIYSGPAGVVDDANNVSAEFSGQRIFLSHTGVSNNQPVTTIFQMKDGEMILGSMSMLTLINGSKITELDNANISGIQIKKDYIGMAAEIEGNRSLISLSPTEIKLGNVTKTITEQTNTETNEVTSTTGFTGTGVLISKDDFWIMGGTNLNIATPNIQLRGINQQSLFAVGNQVEGIASLEYAADTTITGEVIKNTIAAHNTTATNYNELHPEEEPMLTIEASLVAVPDGIYTKNLYAESGKFSGELSGATGTFSGSLIAATGTFKGALEVGTTTIGQASYPSFKVDTNGNLYIGPTSASAWNFKVTSEGKVTINSGSIEIKNDGTTNFKVDDTGKLTAKSGTIGNWTIGTNYIGNSDSSREDSSVGLSSGSSTSKVFWAGGKFNGTGNNEPKFYVTAGGALTAKNATLEGSLTAGGTTTINSNKYNMFQVTSSGIIRIGPYDDNGVKYHLSTSNDDNGICKGIIIRGKHSFKNRENKNVTARLFIRTFTTTDNDNDKQAIRLTAQPEGGSQANVFCVGYEGDVQTTNLKVMANMHFNSLPCWYVVGISPTNHTITFARVDDDGSLKKVVFDVGTNNGAVIHALEAIGTVTYYA